MRVHWVCLGVKILMVEEERSRGSEINMAWSRQTRIKGHLHLARLCRGEEHCLPFLGKKFDDLSHFILEPLLKDTVCLIDNQALQKNGTWYSG